MPYIDIRIEFTTDEEDGYVHHTPSSVRAIASDISEGDLVGIAEAAFQSDLYTVGVSNAMLSALDGETETTEFRW